MLSIASVLISSAAPSALAVPTSALPRYESSLQPRSAATGRAPARAAGGGAEPSAADRAAEARRLWGLPLAVGGSVGLGAPLGLVGLFGEISPRPFASLSWGGGYGTFGAAWAGMLRVRPVILGESAIFAGLGYSVNFTPESARVFADTVVPVASKWANVELGREWRYQGERSLRVAVGHTFLLNGGSFGCRPAVSGGGVCSAASETNVVGWAPYGGVVTPGQAAVASSIGRSTHFWYVHVDFAALFGW